MTRAASVRAHERCAPFHSNETIPLVHADELTTHRHALEGLAHQISHELRTPLNAVIGFSEMMRQELFGPVGSSRYREYLEHINESAQRMLQVAEETLSLTSQLAVPLAAPAAKPFNLSAAAAQAALRAAEDIGRAPSSIDLQIAHSIEVWGCDDTTIAALIYLFRARLLHAHERSETLVSTDWSGEDTLVLNVKNNTFDDIPAICQATGCEASLASADADLFKALGVSLFRQQGAHVDTLTCDAAGEIISIELELSAQQAFML